MTVHDWRDWRIFMEMSPFVEKRMDYRFAKVCQVLAEIHRNPETKKEPFTVDDFLILFGEDAAEANAASKAKEQTLAQQEALIRGWVLGANILAAEENGV